MGSVVIKGNTFPVVYQVSVFVLSFDHFVYVIVDACLVLCLCLLRF